MARRKKTIDISEATSGVRSDVSGVPPAVEPRGADEPGKAPAAPEMVADSSDTGPLSFAQLETLAILRQELLHSEMQACLARDRRLEEPPPLSMKDVAKALGVTPTTMSERIRKIEDSLGTYVVPHKDAAAQKKDRRTVQSIYPEDSRKLQLANPESDQTTQLVPELTLDGKIWSLYAELVVELHRLTRLATKLPAPAPPPMAVPPERRIKLPSGTMASVPPRAPERPAEAARERFLMWLEHQYLHVTDARHFLRENRYATPGNLDRLVPGYEPGPDAEQLWNVEDKLGGFPPDR